MAHHSAFSIFRGYSLSIIEMDTPRLASQASLGVSNCPCQFRHLWFPSWPLCGIYSYRPLRYVQSYWTAWYREWTHLIRSYWTREHKSHIWWHVLWNVNEWFMMALSLLDIISNEFHYSISNILDDHASNEETVDVSSNIALEMIMLSNWSCFLCLLCQFYCYQYFCHGYYDYDYGCHYYYYYYH